MTSDAMERLRLTDCPRFIRVGRVFRRPVGRVNPSQIRGSWIEATHLGSVSRVASLIHRIVADRFVAHMDDARSIPRQLLSCPAHDGPKMPGLGGFSGRSPHTPRNYARMIHLGCVKESILRRLPICTQAVCHAKHVLAGKQFHHPAGSIKDILISVEPQPAVAGFEMG